MRATTLDATKGRLIRCTVSGLTPNLAAILRTPGLPGVASARFPARRLPDATPRRFRSSQSPVTAARTRLTAILPPEVAEAGRRKFGIANRVLNVLMAEPSL